MKSIKYTSEVKFKWKSEIQPWALMSYKLFDYVQLQWPIAHNSDFAFFVFERTKTQPRRHLRCYLVLQRLRNKAALSPGMMHFGTKFWSKMVVCWRYADLSMEWLKKVCVINAKSA